MNKKILLADDNVTIQRVVELTFSGQGYDVTCLRSGKEVLDAARNIRPDVVLLDVGLPGESGYDVCLRMKEEQGLTDVPVMLLTGTFEPFDGERARSVGASAHLTKPFESQVLVERVSELIHNPGASLLPPPKVEPAPVQAAGPSSPQPEAATSPPVVDAASLSPETLDLIARRVVEQISDDVVRQVAWEVVPELAERLVRQRIRQIEEEAG